MSDLPSDPETGATGFTTIPYIVEDEIITGIDRNGIKIIIYKNGFADGYSGVGTLANEFGDATFGVSRPQYNYETITKNSYKDMPTTKYSYDYENYIVKPHKNPKPNPNSY